MLKILRRMCERRHGAKDYCGLRSEVDNCQLRSLDINQLCVSICDVFTTKYVTYTKSLARVVFNTDP